MTVPLMDPHSQYGAVREQIARAIGEVIDSGRFILGPRVGEVERAWASAALAAAETAEQALLARAAALAVG